jgi:FixJ family two-component response regulator
MMNNEAPLAVVDDDADVRLAMTRLLDSAGFAVQSFASGAEFLRSVRDHRPGCVVLDLHMPRMSGFEVQDALASDYPGLPVIVITAHDSPETRARALRLGARGYLCKPVDDEALITAIGAVTA